MKAACDLPSKQHKSSCGAAEPVPSNDAGSLDDVFSKTHAQNKEPTHKNTEGWSGGGNLVVVCVDIHRDTHTLVIAALFAPKKQI